MRVLTLILGLFVCLLLQGCMKWDYVEEESFNFTSPGVFILCEGNFQYGNATLSYYDPVAEEVENEVFARANGMRLGDVAQSMTAFGGKGWIVVNNSHVVFAIDLDTFREKGRIDNLPAPRHILFVDSRKAYVSQIWDSRIFIVDPSKYEITGTIEVPDMDMANGSTEQMVRLGRYVYCTCWSYQNRIIKIDTQSDEVVGQLSVGIQPRWLSSDADGKLWVLTDGGYDGSPYGYESPSLMRIDGETLTEERRFYFERGSVPNSLTVSADGRDVYWINGGVYRMGIDSRSLPTAPVIESRQTKFYGLSISPHNGDIYVADAIDYQQQGMVYRYSSEGVLKDEFYVGVTPGGFCWK